MIAAAKKRSKSAEVTSRKRAERRQQGLCVQCGVPTGGGALCRTHREVNIRRKRAQRARAAARRKVDTSEVILPADRKLCGEQVIAEAREAKSVRRRRPTAPDSTDGLELALDPEEWIRWQDVRKAARDRKAYLDKIRRNKFQVPTVDGPDILTIHEEGGA